MEKILVTGATGRVGREVVRLLSETRAAVRVLVRSPDAAASLERLGVEPAIGDFEEPATIEAALQGATKLFLLTPADPRMVDHQGQTIEAAQRAGVRYVVKVSALGADPASPVSLGRWHAQAEQHIEDSGIPYTHLRPHYFMQNTLAFAPSIALENRLYAPMRDGRIGLVDCRDVAGVAAHVLTEPGHENRVYEITGGAALSFTELASHIGAAIGRTVTYVDVRPSEAERAMISAGTPGWLAEALIGLYGIFSANHASAITRVVDDLCGKPARTFAAFTREYANVFANA